MSEHIQKIFDDIAPKYDFLNSLMSLRLDRRWRRQAIQVLTQKSYPHVIDLCAGTLALTRGLLEADPNCHVTAVDFSRPMLEKGEAALPELLKKRVTLLVQDAQHLNLPRPSYDAVMCAYGMRNIEDNELVLKKIFSLLRPGGQILILDFFKPEGFFSGLFQKTYAEYVIPYLGGKISRNPEAYRHLRDSVRAYYTPSLYRDILRKIGFENVTIQAQTFGVSHLITAEKPLY